MTLHNRDHNCANIVVEYGDTSQVKHAFGLGETKVYEAFNAGLISGVLIRKDPTSPRGRRLFSFASIRTWLAGLEKSGADAPKSDAARMVAAARESRRRTRHVGKDDVKTTLP
jgi:hypothetical protein